ncbi:carbohydrate binding domain-containing protein [Pseudaquidulcibacter saccharophilus]|uniref:carbohydrate binding domain-containing protein n=1 Tax=Pseudaquidulcibacter saccharophilus TaxID=2831900 RepID=UPI001EFF586E|nr:carbohydrate binding domain-containing protein [Pseudaquidulcibacter saccharophilus]
MRKFLFLTTALLIPAYSNAQNLDNFEDLVAWQAAASDGVSSLKSSVKGVDGKAIRFDYDFNNHGGYAFVRRKLPISYPENYVISFYIRGQGLKNNLEFKLSNSSGDTVWWNQKRDFELTNDWQLIRIKKRQVSFAWGPVKDAPLTHSDGLEFVITAGNGGKGFVEIDNLKIEPLDAENTPPPPIKISKQGDSQIFDLGRVREFGGISLEWDKTGNISYDIASSLDGKKYTPVQSIQNSDGGNDLIKTTEAEAKFIRITSKSAAVKNFKIEPLEFGANYNSFLYNVAANSIRGAYPRAFYNQQEYWTLMGVDGGGNQGALISEDGAIEIGRGGFSIAPFVMDGNKLFTYQDVKVSHSLMDNYLPIPTATWFGDGFELKNTGFVSGTKESSFVHGIYELKNTSDKSKTLKLALYTRPTQVNSPKQFLATEGGYAPINSVTLNNNSALINQTKVIYSEAAKKIATSDFYEGNLIEKLNNNELPTSAYSQDKNGLAQGLMVYEITLKPGESKSISFNAPLNGQTINQTDDYAALKQTADFWRKRLSNVDIKLGGNDQDLANTIKTSIANILIMRDGVILRPGARSYARSWIRDGVMIAEELLRYGYTKEAIDYLDYFSKYQFENGKIPCCVDFRGSDPVPENDSQGEYIHLVKLVYDYTKDSEIPKKYWKNVKAAYDYMNNQRLSERTDDKIGSDTYGLLPPSISHEGYSDKPAYSHWDNFWGLRGYEDAQTIAFAAEEYEQNDAIYYEKMQFADDIKNSIMATQKRYGFKYIAGAADRGDFDATSTTIALLLGVDRYFPREWFYATFDKYWDNFIKRRDIDKEWKDYTPYEWRVVSAFSHLGQSDRAESASNFFMNDRHPHEWNAFAEVVGREVRTPRFLGDLPHGWVASDFIRAATDRIVYEDANTLAIVVGAGVNPNWLSGEGIRIDGLVTTQGKVSIAAKSDNKKTELNLKISGEEFPIGGFIIPQKLFAGKKLYINGKLQATKAEDYYFGAPIVEMK